MVSVSCSCSERSCFDAVCLDAVAAAVAEEEAEAAFAEGVEGIAEEDDLLWLS